MSEKGMELIDVLYHLLSLPVIHYLSRSCSAFQQNFLGLNPLIWPRRVDSTEMLI